MSPHTPGSEDDDDNNHKGSKAAAAARAAVAASLNVFSDEFLSWAAAGGGGEDLEQKLLSDVAARGTESSCKSLFVAALLDELVAAGHRTLVFSQSRVMLDVLQVRVANVERGCVVVAFIQIVCRGVGGVNKHTTHTLCK